MMSELYGDAFFSQMLTCRDAYRRLADAIRWACYPFHVVVDVGCGLGFVIQRLAEVGAMARGLDLYAPAWIEKMRAKDTSLSARAVGASLPDVIAFDVTRPRVAVAEAAPGWVKLLRPEAEADLVICTETAEHVPEEAAITLVDNVASLCVGYGKIVWSAAPPGQAAQDPSAVGHVNERPPEYWLELFRHKGFSPDGPRTQCLREKMGHLNAQHMYASESFYVLVH